MINVIVPVYNVEKYLRKCLDSLLNQTYQNIEVIMVDDGSKDSSGKICDEYAKRYNNFSVIHKKNAGLGMARNTGLEYVKGDYVTFLDSDDYLEPTTLEVLYKNLMKNKVDMCKAGFRRFKDSGETVSIRGYCDEIFESDEAKYKLLPRMIGSSPTKHDSVEMCVCGVLYNAEKIKVNKIRFPSERQFISEDMIFNIDYLQFANGACTISNTGYCYRVNTGSLTKSYRPDRFDACRYFYLEVKKKLEKLGYDSDTILRLQRIFFIYLRMCIGQEKRSISGNTRRKSISNIREICNDLTVRKIIESYPVNCLEIKQKLFIVLIKCRMAALLYDIAELGKI